MLEFLIGLFILTIFFGIAFKITGALLKACVWLFLFLPVGLILWAIGVACCCTLVLIPVGVMLFKAGARVIIPG